MLKFSASLKAEAEMHISDEQDTKVFWDAMFCMAFHPFILCGVHFYIGFIEMI